MTWLHGESCETLALPWADAGNHLQIELGTVLPFICSVRHSTRIMKWSWVQYGWTAIVQFLKPFKVEQDLPWNARRERQQLASWELPSISQLLLQLSESSTVSPLSTSFDIFHLFQMFPISGILHFWSIKITARTAALALKLDLRMETVTAP